jgi:para-aminobenzoate synthetase component 1
VTKARAIDISDLSEVDLIRWFASREVAVILESQTPVGPHSRYTILATDPLVRFRVQNGTITLTTPANEQVITDRNPWDVLAQLITDHSPATASDLPLSGGWLGYVGYEAYRYLQDSPVPAYPSSLPDIHLILFGTLVIMDRLTGKKTQLQRDTHFPLSVLSADTLSSVVPPSFKVTSTPEALMSKEAYLATVVAAKTAIAAGDIYQANVAIPFSCQYTGDTSALFHRLRDVSPVPYAAYVKSGLDAVISASPEQFLTLNNGHLQTRPIKGTAPRMSDPTEDALQKAQLSRSEKDNAELVMIVDLMRNDFSRVCVPGTVTVPAIKTVESFAQVHHLVATVEGKLQPGLSPIDVMKATFPCGSITGAPKISAMRHIYHWENQARGPFCGAIGLIGYPPQLNLNVAIRTAYAHDDTLYFWAGSGIVADSDPQAEYDEILAKAAGIMQALESFI